MNSKNSKFQIRNEIVNSELHLFLSGPLNEDSLFTSASFEPTSMIHIHLDELTSINSTGIRQWVIWVKDYPESEWQLWGCPPHFINNLNMIDKFVPKKSKVKTFYLPFFSQETGEEIQILIERESWESQPNKIETPRDSSGNLMHPDIIEDRFFKFCHKY